MKDKSLTFKTTKEQRKRISEGKIDEVFSEVIGKDLE
jgi:hypothetical protein